MLRYLLFSILFFLGVYCNCQEDKIVIGIIDSVHSEILNEKRPVWIYLPDSYNSTIGVKYPVLYLLDGEVYFYSLSGMVKQQSSFGATSYPESVIVAIPNINRNRDLMPYDPEDDNIDSTGIELFTDFLENELIPFIDRKYPTLQHRTLIGHSLGGSFVISTLVNHQELFTNYLAIDPALKFHDHRFFNYTIEQIGSHDFKNKSLFLTVANTMPQNMDTATALKDTTWITSTIRSNLNFAKAVEQLTNNSLDYQWSYFSNKSHLSVPTVSQYYGLKYFFSWNSLDLDKIIRTNPDISGKSLFDKVTGHYKMITEKIGYSTLAKYEQMNDLGYYYLQKKDVKGAVLFFQYNIDHYPEVSNSYDSMGDFFLAAGKPEKAAEMFKKAINIDNNPNSSEKLKELNKKDNEP